MPEGSGSRARATIATSKRRHACQRGRAHALRRLSPPQREGTNAREVGLTHAGDYCRLNKKARMPERAGSRTQATIAASTRRHACQRSRAHARRRLSPPRREGTHAREVGLPERGGIAPDRAFEVLRASAAADPACIAGLFGVRRTTTRRDASPPLPAGCSPSGRIATLFGSRAEPGAPDVTPPSSPGRDRIRSGCRTIRSRSRGASSSWAPSAGPRMAPDACFKFMSRGRIFRCTRRRDGRDPPSVEVSAIAALQAEHSASSRRRPVLARSRAEGRLRMDEP
jgi:hypothetical protein